MKFFIRTLTFVVVLFVFWFGVVSAVDHFFPAPAQAAAVAPSLPHTSVSLSPVAATDPEGLAMHHILMSSASESAGCTASAIGEHTLLTAAHCIIGTDHILVDATDATVLSASYDGNDHVILVLSGVHFDHTLGLDQRDPREKEIVRLWGNPGHSRNVYREGYFSGKDTFSGADGQDHVLWIFILPVYAGDSGSALVTSDGKIITVLSLGNQSAEAAVFPLAFTPDQLRRVA